MSERREKGEGGLYQKTVNGKLMWQASEEVRTTTGKRRRITGTAETKSHARQRLQANLSRFYQRGGVTLPVKSHKPAHGSLTVAEWVYQWHAGLNPQTVSDTVRRAYRRNAELHIIPHLGDMQLTAVTLADIETLFSSTLPAKTKPNGEPLLSSSALSNIFKTLNLIMKRAVVEDKLVKNPTEGAHRPRHQRKDERVNQTSHMALSLIKILETHPDRLRHLLPFLGLRRSEKLGLEWNCVTNLSRSGQTKMRISQQLARYENGDGYYIKRRTKTRASTRVLPVPEPFLSALKEYKKQQDAWKKTPEWNPEPQFADLIFTTRTGKPITMNRDNMDWHALLEENNYPYWRGHLNRHITATMLSKQNPPVPLAIVKEILGHNSEAMSHYYTEMDVTTMTKPLEDYGAWMVAQR